MKRRWLRALPIALVAMLAGAPVASSLIAPDADNGPPDPNYTFMSVKSGKVAKPAVWGTYCLPSKANPALQTCHTAPSYPLPGAPKLSVTRGDKVMLRFHAPAGYITWRAARVSAGKERVTASGEAQVAGTSKRTWTVTLPKNLSHAATVLGFSVTYLNAYNTYEVGIKVR